MVSSGQSWLAGRAEAALRIGMERAYRTVQVKPHEYLLELRMAHNLPVQSYEGMFSLPVESLDFVAQQTVRGAMKMAAMEAAGFDLGGVLGIVPDMGVLAAITMRTLQKLSLIYGFEYNTDEEAAELWIAAATAVGVDISKDLLERTVIRRFVRAVSRKIAARLSAEFAEKFAARAIPIASSAVGAAMNWYFMRAWGKRALMHFRERHLAVRSLAGRNLQETKSPILLPPAPTWQEKSAD